MLAKIPSALFRSVVTEAACNGLKRNAIPLKASIPTYTRKKKTAMRVVEA